MSISRVAFWSCPPEAANACKTLRPGDGTDASRREASIMSISRVAFYHMPSPSCKRLQNPSPQ